MITVLGGVEKHASLETLFCVYNLDINKECNERVFFERIWKTTLFTNCPAL
jgi:hypothetical protein